MHIPPSFSLCTDNKKKKLCNTLNSGSNFPHDEKFLKDKLKKCYPSKWILFNMVFDLQIYQNIEFGEILYRYDFYMKSKILISV